MECNQCGGVVSHDPGSVVQYLTDGRNGRSWVMRAGTEVVHACPADTLPLAVPSGRHRHWSRNRMVLADALDEVIAVAGGTMGTVQSVVDGRLHLAASRGFRTEFVQHFAVVDAGHGSACSASFGDTGQVVVVDVDASTLFTEESRRVVRAAGVRSVVSTPMTTPGGRNLGVVSTHRPHPDAWNDDTLERIAKIADRTAMQLH